MNDMQQHVLKKVTKASDDYRRSCRERATHIVTVIADALEAGVPRERIIDDIAAALLDGREKGE